MTTLTSTPPPASGITVPNPVGGGTAGNPTQGTTGGTYNMPKAPTQIGDPAQWFGPYQADYNSAQNAYDQAVAQLGAQRSQMYTNYGIDSAGNLDESNPYGAFEQAQLGGASSAHQAEAAMQHRGLGNSGLAGQAEDAAQAGYEGAKFGLTQGVLGGEQSLDTATSNALGARDARQLQDEMSQLAYDQQNGIFTVSGPQRTGGEANQVVAAMYAAWKAKYGSGKDKQGETFQQMIDRLGAGLYDPTRSFKLFGKSYGG